MQSGKDGAPHLDGADRAVWGRGARLLQRTAHSSCARDTVSRLQSREKLSWAIKNARTSRETWRSQLCFVQQQKKVSELRVGFSS